MVQRVSSACVIVEATTVGAIGEGLLVYLGAAIEDTDADVVWLADKVHGLRIFEDDAGKMSRSVDDVGGAMLVVSQFTLLADTRTGRRPSFTRAAPPASARRLYDAFCDALRTRGARVQTGRFQATMQVHAVVAGPVTILLDSTRSL